MRSFVIFIVAVLLVTLSIPVEKTAYAENTVKKEKIDTSADKNGFLKKKNTKIRLTIQKVIDYLIRKNYDFKKTLIDFKGSSSHLLLYNSKYNTYLFGSADFTYSDNPNSSTAIFSGKHTDRGIYSLGLQKSFSSGTTIKAGVGGMIQNIKGSNFGGGMGYQHNVTVNLTQELLKNSFGITDRMEKKQLANITKMTRQAIKMKLAGLIVESIINYWNIAIAVENLETSKKSLGSTIEIRNLIGRKLKLGLSEREDILDWNSKVLLSRNMIEYAEKKLFDSKLAVIRNLNLDNDINDIEIGATFQKTAPDISLAKALKDAYLKRVDWSNQKTMLKNAELAYKVARNNMNPSLKLKLGAGSLDYSSKTYGQSLNSFGIDKELSAGIELTYPLENTAAKVTLRDARLNLKKEKINQKSLEKQIRDDVRSIIKMCQVSYKIYLQTKQSKEYARNYYNQVLIKFRRGRYSAIQVKLALDSYIQSRYNELQSLVNYNIALLQRDFARNVIFENYKIDVDSLLKRLIDK